MKGLGIVLVVIGFLLMGTAAVSFVTELRGGHGGPAKVEVRDQNGETMAILPLLGVVAIALGGALVTAHYVTRNP